MQITVDDNHIRLDFRFRQAIVDRIKSHLPKATWDGERKCWWLPASEAHRLPDALPKAQYSYDAIGAICDAEAALGERFYAMCRRLHIALHVDADGHVIASGDNVSQLVATEVHRRSELLRPYVQAERDEDESAKKHAAPDVQPTRGDELIAASLRNAWDADQRRRSMARKGRR